jgi:hypothetical protein
MTASWMFYATCVGLLLAAAAAFLERPLRNRVGATRVGWITVLVGALLWPATIALRNNPVPLNATAANPAAASVSQLRQATAPGTAIVRSPQLVTLPAVLPASATLDSAAR